MELSVNNKNLGQITQDPILGAIDYYDRSVCTSHLQARELIAVLHDKYPQLLQGPIHPGLKTKILALGGICDTITLVQDQHRNLGIVTGEPNLVALGQICADRPLWDCRLFLKTLLVTDLTSPGVKQLLSPTEPLMDTGIMETLTEPVQDILTVPSGSLDSGSLDSGSETSESAVILTDSESCAKLGGTPDQTVSYPITQDSSDTVDTVVNKVVESLTKQFPKAFSTDDKQKRCFVPRLHSNTLTEKLTEAVHTAGVEQLDGNVLLTEILAKNFEYSQRNLPELLQRTGKRYHAKTRQKDCKFLGTVRRNGSWYLSCVYQPKAEGAEYRIFDHSWISSLPHLSQGDG